MVRSKLCFRLLALLSLFIYSTDNTQSAFRHLEALACESFARFAEEMGEHHLPVDYMKKAYNLYIEWGAAAKASNPRNEYPADLGNDDRPTPLDSAGSNVRRPFEASTNFRRSSWWTQNSVSSVGMDFSDDQRCT